MLLYKKKLLLDKRKEGTVNVAIAGYGIYLLTKFAANYYIVHGSLLWRRS